MTAEILNFSLPSTPTPLTQAMRCIVRAQVIANLMLDHHVALQRELGELGKYMDMLE